VTACTRVTTRLLFRVHEITANSSNKLLYIVTIFKLFKISVALPHFSQSSIITFRVSRRRRECIVITRVCVSVRLSVCLSAASCLHYCTDSGVTWGSGRGCPLVVQYLADLQSGHGLCCYGNTTRTRNVSENMLVLALCLVSVF